MVWGAMVAGILAMASASPRVQPVVRAPAGSVNVYRDSHGQAHLYARREEDAYFGLGYALGEDRLPQVLLFYLSLRGELAKAFGPGPVGDKPGIAGTGPVPVPDAVASDIEARRWRYLEDGRLNLRDLSPARQRDLSAFMAGLQRYMTDHPERVPAWAPPLEPALVLAAEGSLMLANDAPRAECASPSLTRPLPLPLPASTGADHASPPLKGSNIWALNALRTVEGAAMFSSDSHGEIEAFGSLFYAARISSDGLDAWLLDMAGMPIGLKGHSRRFAWGWSEGPRFPSDCVRIETLPGRPNRYLYDGHLRRIESTPYRIAVKGAPDVTGRFDFTRHNGVRSPVLVRTGRAAYAISSAYAGREGRAGDAFAAMLRAKDWPAMRRALALRELYPANLIVAGSDGSILYIRPGRLPRRAPGQDVNRAVDGSTSRAAWRGLRDIGEVLQVKDPPEGFLTNENVSPDQLFDRPGFDPAAYPPDYAFEPGLSGTRQRRAIALLGGARKLSFADGLAVVGDTLVPGHERWSAALRAARRTAPSHDPAVDRFEDGLEAFDGRFDPESAPALHHALWRLALREGGGGKVLALERKVMSAAPLEPGEQALLLSAAAAALGRVKASPHGLDTHFGEVFRVGRGGSDHPARGLTLLPLGDDSTGLSDFGSLWSSVYAPSAGGRLRDVSGTRWPFLIQFTRPIRSYSLSAYGYSDDPASPHYADQAADMAQAKLHSNAFEPAELAASPTTLRVLRTRTPAR